MPGIAPSNSPYPLASDITTLARVRVNDCGLSLAGDLLADSVPSTVVLLNAAYRWLQSKESNSGVESFISEVQIATFPASYDSTIQCWLGWGGCQTDFTGVDGSGSQYSTPALPKDLYFPTEVWSRQSGFGEFSRMYMADGALPIWGDPWIYEWRQDGLYFFGSNFTRDFRIRYSAVRGSLRLDVPYPVPMMFCENALSARLAYEFANLRGATQAPAMQQLAEEEYSLIAQASARKNQRKSIRRQPYGGRMFSNPWPIIR